MPSPWDDDYFFAALPTLPEDGEQAPDTAGGGDPVATVAAETPTTSDKKEAQAAAEGDAPATAPRKRRRRRRRRKKPVDPGTATPESSQTGEGPASDDDTEQEP